MTTVTEQEMPAMQWMRTQQPELRTCSGGGREGGRAEGGVSAEWKGKRRVTVYYIFNVCVCVQYNLLVLVYKIPKYRWAIPIPQTL